MSENLSDNELVTLIRNGEYRFLQELINRYMPYIVNAASRYNVAGIDVEDLIQEGVVAVFSAVKSYDDSKASFKTFVFLCINRAIASAISRVNGSARHIPDALISPIDEVELADMSSPESILIDKENYTALQSSIKDELSDFEYKVLREYLAGESYANIAEALGVSAKSVDNALRRIRSKLSSN